VALPSIRTLNSSCEYIQPLMRAGKQASWDDLLLQINRRKPKLVQQIGTQQVQNILRQVIDLS